MNCWELINALVKIGLCRPDTERVIRTYAQKIHGRNPLQYGLQSMPFTEALYRKLAEVEPNQTANVCCWLVGLDLINKPEIQPNLSLPRNNWMYEADRRRQEEHIEDGYVSSLTSRMGTRAKDIVWYYPHDVIVHALKALLKDPRSVVKKLDGSRAASWGRATVRREEND